MKDYKIGICKKEGFCADCKDDCIHAGNEYADCPRYECLHDFGSAEHLDCAKCEWLKDYKRKARESRNE